MASPPPHRGSKMAIMVIGGGDPEKEMRPKMNGKKIRSIGEDYEDEEKDEGGSSMEHAASLVADALGVEADNIKLAKALSAFVSACKG